MITNARFVRRVAALAVALSLPTAAIGQTFPAKPVRLIVPVAPGGNQDLIARAVMQRASEALGQPIVVENRPGVSGIVGSEYVARQPADGHTLLSISNTFVTVPSVVPNVPYDPVKDFVAIGVIALIPQVLVVHPSLPARSVREFVALAKSRPGQLDIAMSGPGSTGHIASVLFNRMAGIEVTHIPYKGNAPAIVDLVAGYVSGMYDQISTSIQHIRAGKMRPIAVTTTRRSPLLPEVPTISEAGLAGYEYATFNAVLAPAATPREALARLHAAISKATRAADLRERFAGLGIELVTSASPEEATAWVRAETARMAKLVREAGIKAEQ